MKWFNKLERKYGKYAIHNLMKYLILFYAGGFVLEVFAGNFYSRYLALDIEKVLSGQVWRLITFIMGPPNTDIFFILFSLYLYFMIGTVLEQIWGAFRFNAYVFSGIVLHILAALIIYLIFGVSFPFTTYYLNMSMFLAFAFIMPDMQLLLFFIIPIKIKWLAYVDIAYFVATVVAGFFYPILPASVLRGLSICGVMIHPVYATAALVSLLNFVLFYFITRNQRAVSLKEFKRKVEYAQKVKASQTRTKHKCAVCGKTEKDGEDLVFRYCSKCEGNYEYCNEHLYTHKHVVKTFAVKEDE